MNYTNTVGTEYLGYKVLTYTLLFPPGNEDTSLP